MIRILIYCTLISLVLVTPFIYSDELYNGLISAKQIWCWGAMALLILGYAIERLFSRKKTYSALNLMDLSLLAFYFYFFFRACFTPFTPVLYNEKFLNYSLLVMFYFIVKHACSESLNWKTAGNETNNKTNPTIQIIVIILMLTGLVQAVWGLMQLYGFTRSFHSGFKITGTLFNPAPYALYLAAIFPIALAIIMKESSVIKELKNEKVKEFVWTKSIFPLYPFISSLFHSFFHILKYRFTYYIALSTIISIILILPATMNRASWIGVVVSSTFILNHRYNLIDQARGWLKSRIRRIMAIAGILVVVVSIISGLYQLKAGSSFGRLFIWEVTAGKIAERPLFGYGVGRFQAEYNNWQADYFKNHPEEMDGPKGMTAGNTIYCFNEYLEMASEIGLIGLILFLAVIVSVFLAIKNRKMNELIILNEAPNFYNCSYFNTLIFSLISLLFCALISFPFYSLPTLIVFFLLLAIISSKAEKIQVFNSIAGLTLIRRLQTVAIFFILIPVSALLLFLMKQQYKAYWTFDEAVKLYQTGSYDEACKSFSKVYPPLQYTGPYLQYYGKALNMNKEYPRSVEMLKRAANFTSDEVLYTTLGDSYKALKKYSDAEGAYQLASFMVPQKLYPLYLLVKLFNETGQHKKALCAAKLLLRI